MYINVIAIASKTIFIYINIIASNIKTNVNIAIIVNANELIYNIIKIYNNIIITINTNIITVTNNIINANINIIANNAKTNANIAIIVIVNKVATNTKKENIYIMVAIYSNIIFKKC